MRIVVLGASGYLGARLLQSAQRLGTVVGTRSQGSDPSLSKFDLANPDADASGILAGADLVYVAAALSSPDACSREPVRARAINVTGTIRTIEAAVAAGARVIFLSSDAVYGEREDAFDESAACNPAGDYAVMKHEVEQHFAGHPRVRGLRLSYVFSRADKFTRYLCQCVAAGQAAEIFHPFYRAVVHLEDVIEAALALGTAWEGLATQFVNLGGPAVIARTEFAAALQRLALPALNCRITQPAADFFISRPRIIRMRSPHFATLLGREPRTLDEAIRIEFPH